VLLGVLFGTQSICFSATITWVAALYQDAGWDRGDAALATAVIPLTTVIVALTIPRLSDSGGRMAWLSVTAATMAVGLFGMALWPESGGLFWVLLFGLGNGAIFPLLLTLPLDLRSRPSEVVTLTAWMQGIGYALTAVGPPLAGGLRDATGGFRTPFIVLGFMALSCLALTRVVAREGRRA
jgi:CP family cyanate transporter-like MFS transporter